MEQYNISWIRFLVVVAGLLLSCSPSLNHVEKKYVIFDGEKENEIVITPEVDNSELYIDLLNVADSLLMLSNGSMIVNADSIHLEVLSKEIASVERQEFTFTSYYLVVNYLNDRHFYWGVNVNEETVYFTNPDGNKTLKLMSKTVNKEKIDYTEPLNYIVNKYLKVPPMPLK